MLAVLTGEGD